MCYSVPTSLIAYAIGLLSSIAAFYIGHPVVGTLIGTYSSVQLAEAVIWHSINTRRRSLNQFGTRMLMANLSVHAVLTVSAAIYFGVVARRNVYTRREKLALFVMWVLALAATGVTVGVQEVHAETVPVCDPDGVFEKKEPADGTLRTRPPPRFGCRLWWDSTLVRAPVITTAYVVQVLLIFATLFLVYQSQPAVYGSVASFFVLGIAVMVVTAYVTRRRHGLTVKQAVATGVSTMWCFVSAVGAPVLVGALWLGTGGRFGRGV